MKRNMWNKIVTIGMAFGMLTASMPVLAFEDEMIVEDDSYIVVEDDTEAPMALETDDTDEGDYDESFISEDDEPETGDELTLGIAAEETEEELQAAASTETSGTCGDNLTWEIYEDGTLFISGTGGMDDYSYNGSPFYTRTDIKSVIIESGVTSIGSCAFYECSYLTSITISNSVTSIGDYAFSGCGKLTSITIPNSVTSIGKTVFRFCNSLKNIMIPNSVTSIRAFTFESSGLTSITIPNSVTSIENYAFRGCRNLTSIGLPSGLTDIGFGAFENCSNLINIDLPERLTSMGENAFYQCSSLRSITIPNSVTSIEGGAFSQCSSLTSITIPNSVTSIRRFAFGGCSSLTSIMIPYSVTSIEECVFSQCSNLTSIQVEENNSVYDSRNNCNAIIEKLTNTLVTGCKNTVIPNSVTSIGSDAFSYCSSLTSITIPNSITSIGNYAFFDCSSLTGITIPNSVTSIGKYVFSNCSTLTSITIPPSVTSIGERAFQECDQLTIYGHTGSYAETYALENNIPFVAIEGGDTPQGFHHTLDYYATTSSTTYNPELACDLMKLAWDAYGPNTVRDEHHVGTDEEILADYDALGFTEKYSKNYSRWQYFNDYCGFSFAAKDADDGGRIVVITIRGTVGGIGHLYDASPEWISDLLPTVPAIAVTGWHMGLYNPAYDIVNTLDEEELIKTTNTKYFITGHSRGAGVGNVLAVLLSQRGVSRENLYDYNFACPDTMYAPAGTSWSGSGRYNNIFNITAANDLVGVVPGILGYSVGLAAQLLKRQFTVHTWGKYGKTYYYSFNWNNYENSTVNPLSFISDQGDTNPHQPSLYYNYLSKLNNTDSFKSYADVKINNLSYLTSFLKCFTGFCPVDMTIVDGKGADIVSVTNGEVIYHNNYGMKDAIVMTDGDFKAFFVDPSIDCKVKISATDSGEMAFVSSLVNMNTEEISDEKHFENVKLESGKAFLSEGLSQTSAGNVKLYTTDSKGNKVAEVNSDGKETKIVKPATPKKVTEKITITKKPTIKKPAAAKGKITVKWKHFKHTSKKAKKIWKKIKKVQIQCATDKAFKNIVKTSLVGKSKTSAKIKGLKKKTTYYVRVRYYDGIGYSAWSKAKKVKTK